jgi:recombination protein RecT
MSDTNKTLDNLRVAPQELKAIAGLTAQEAGPNVEAFFTANKDKLNALVAGVVRPERLLKVAQTAIRSTPGLRQCTVASLFGAVVVCAIMGLEPNTHEGLCWLIPRKSSQPRRNERGVIMTDARGGFIWDERWEVNVQVGYKGHIALAYRNPMVKLIHTGIIHENDEYRIIEGTTPRIEHFPRTAGERGEPIIFYAICKLATGETLFEWMSRGQVERIRDNFSDAFESADAKRQQAAAVLDRGGDEKAMARARRDLEKAEAAPWIRDFDQMARKTLINRIRNYIPSNRQSSLAETLDTRDMRRQSQNLAQFLDGGDLDGEFEAHDDEPGDGHDSAQGGQIGHVQHGRHRSGQAERAGDGGRGHRAGRAADRPGRAGA